MWDGPPAGMGEGIEEREELFEVKIKDNREDNLNWVRSRWGVNDSVEWVGNGKDSQIEYDTIEYERWIANSKEAEWSERKESLRVA